MTGLKKRYPKWIDEYAKSIFRLFHGMDLRTLEPLDCFHFHPLYSDLWLERIYQAIEKFKKKKLPFEKAVEAFPNPSSCRAMWIFIVCHLNNVIQAKKQFDKKKIREIFNFYLRILEAKNKKDIFAYRSNIGHNKEEIKELIKKIKWQKGSPNVSRGLGRLYLALSSLVNGLMSDWCTDNGIEVWGPYDTSPYFGKNTILVIRDFPCLKPEQLWPHAKRYKYNKIKIYTIYKNVSLRLEFVGCHTIFKGDLAKNLISYAVLVDDKYRNKLKDIEELTSHFLKLAQDQYIRIRNLDFESLKQKILEQEHYQLKDFFNLVGEDWKPSEEIRQRVKGKKLLKGLYPLLTHGFSFEEINKKFGINNLKKIFSE